MKLVGGGGFLVPEEYSTELIEYLRPLSVIRSMNPVIVPMPVGSISIPAMTGGATAEYIGEGSNIAVSQPAFGQIKLTWKKLATLVPISNDLIRFSSPQADAIVRDDLVAAMAQREDAALFGTMELMILLRGYVTGLRMIILFLLMGLLT